MPDGDGSLTPIDPGRAAAGSRRGVGRGLSSRRPSVRTAALLGLGAVACWLALYINLSRMARWFTYTLLGLPAGAHFSSAVEFLVFEVPKVLLLADGGGLRSGHRPLLLHPGEDAADSGGHARVGRHGTGGPARRRDAVLLLLGSSPLPRVCDGGGSAGRHVFIPDLGAHGERGGSRAAVRALRLEGGR